MLTFTNEFDLFSHCTLALLVFPAEIDGGPQFSSNDDKFPIYLQTNIANSCGGKFGAPALSPESNTMKINAESDKVPSPLSPQKFSNCPQGVNFEGNQFQA
jgi:hypothetical protein